MIKYNEEIIKKNREFIDETIHRLRKKFAGTDASIVVAFWHNPITGWASNTKCGIFIDYYEAINYEKQLCAEFDSLKWLEGYYTTYVINVE